MTTSETKSQPPSPFPTDSFPVEPEALERLSGRLADLGAQRGLIDVGYRTVDSPVGPLLLAATDSGLVRVAFEREGFDAVLEALAGRLSPRVVEAPRRLDRAAEQVEEYFAGWRRAFDLPLDRALSSGFGEAVHRCLPSIEYGRTLSYWEVAELVGSPKAVRAVGSACARNPLPIVVPCHRVLRSDGGLGGYLGGEAAKRALLRLEGGMTPPGPGR